MGAMSMQTPMRRAALALAPFVGAAVLLAPVLLTDRPFGQDWPLHLWMTEQQRRGILAGGLPTLSSHFRQVGFLYPSGVFLGGPFYAVAGYLSVPLGGAAAGFVAAQVLAVAAALAGWARLARLAGVDGPLAFVPGVVHCCSAY